MIARQRTIDIQAVQPVEVKVGLMQIGQCLDISIPSRNAARVSAAGMTLVP